MPLKTKKLIRTNSYPENIDKQYKQDAERCVRCGKPVKNPIHYVHLIDGGGLLLHPDDEDKYNQDDPGNLGCHPVGSECMKHLKTWTFKIQNQ